MSSKERNGLTNKTKQHEKINYHLNLCTSIIYTRYALILGNAKRHNDIYNMLFLCCRMGNAISIIN